MLFSQKNWRKLDGRYFSDQEVNSNYVTNLKLQVKSLYVGFSGVKRFAAL